MMQIEGPSFSWELNNLQMYHKQCINYTVNTMLRKLMMNDHNGHKLKNKIYECSGFSLGPPLALPLRRGVGGLTN